MKKITDLLKTSILGGLIVVLPVALLLFLFKWIFNFTTNLIQPMTNFILKAFQMPEFFADVIVLIVIVVTCFLVGIFVRTRMGLGIYHIIETNFLKKAPFYSIIKETILQFLGNNKSPFSAVALVQLFENSTLATAFVTDEHDGRYTVFVPTGPNPTSGNIYHLKSQFVHPVNIPVEQAMRSIISCGAGSTNLITEFKKNNNS